MSLAKNHSTTIYNLIAAPFVAGNAYQKSAEEIFRQTANFNVKKQGKFFDAIHGQFINLFYAGRYFEYINLWENILACLQRIDSQLYNNIQKGTPYYFCGVACFKAEDYQRAVFYFDAALIEDKNRSTGWKKLPAALFLTLNTRNKKQFAFDLTCHTADLMKETLKEFRVASQDNYSLKNLRKYFLAQSLFEAHEWRSAITALFSFVLEREKRIQEFSLRSIYGGTMEPFYLHLFKGCLLLETLFKLSPMWKGKEETAMLGTILNDIKMRNKLGLTDRISEVKKIFNEVVGLNAAWRNRGISPADRFVWTAYGIRNTTGHKLSWSASMTLDDYKNISEDILFAIYLVLLKLYR